jgi:glycerol kinase
MNLPATCWPWTRARRVRAASSSMPPGGSSPWPSANSASLPRPGWVEHDPMEIWQHPAGHGARGAGQGRRHRRPTIAAIGITNQRETTVVWNRRTGEPLHNAIVWQDRRTAAACATLRAAGGLEEAVRERTGLVHRRLLLGHQAGLDPRPRARRTRRRRRGELAFGTIDSWLLWQLTGGAVHATDVSNASRTMLFDIHRNLGRRAAGSCCSTCRAQLLPAVHAVEPRLRRHACRLLRRADRCHRRHGRRPAERAVRPGLLLRRAWPRTPTAPAASC